MKAIKYFLILILLFFNNILRPALADNPKVDSIILAFMNKWDLPGGSFTMSYNGNIIYSKGYGVADIVSMAPVTTKSLFRIASCTKPFTAVSIMQLIEEGKLDLTDTVFGENGILSQSQYQNIKDPRVLQITVEDLLEHLGGWDSSIEGDPMFMAVEIAQWANIEPPAMQETIIEYTLSQMMLNYDPGTTYAYSNFGYCVLGRVIEKITGMVYEDYVRQNVLIPSGSSGMQQGRNLESERFPQEVHYYGCPGEMTTTSVYGNGETVPWPYAGFNIEAMDSHGDWIASSEDLVNFLAAVHRDKLINYHTYTIMVTPPSVNPYYAKGWAVNSGNIFHVGSLPGTISEIVKATNKYAWALVFNKRNLNDTIYDDLDALGWNIQPYLQHVLSSGAPEKHSLFQNYPNPFNTSTRINYDVAVPGIVKLEIFDLTGRQIRTLINEFRDAGSYRVDFDANDLSSGIYIYKMRSGNFEVTRKMALVK